MGILRSDRVSGLDGANAINGSVRFNGNYLDIADVDTAFGTGGDWTMECWINPQEVALKAITDPRTANSSVHPLLWISGGNGGKTVGVLYYYTSGADRIVGTTVLQSNTWYHVAVVRNSGTTHLYVNGTSEGSFSDTLDYASTPTFRIGQRYDGTPYNYDGYISDFRLINGTALYTANFTPPAQRLENISGTEILCCQSPGNVEQEATGKTITAPIPTNGAAAQASRFVPDKGEDHGTTFEDNTKFDTLSYMVPPGGTTTQSNRGRCIVSNGAPGSQALQYLQMQSGGILQSFGNLANAAALSSGCGSSTRMLVADGYISPASTNIIEYLTIATTSNGTNFGDLTVARRRPIGMSNTTRGVWAGGSSVSPTPYLDTIDYNTIATLSDATDFGDASSITAHGGGVSSSTRGIFSIGYTGGSAVNTLEYITFATTGDATNFGDLTAAKHYHFRGCSSSDSTRGLFAGGYNPSVNTIDYITMASEGNATDFGDLTVARRSGMATGNSIDAIFVGGYIPGVNGTVDKVIIQTTGDAVNWGDLSGTAFHEGACSSDSHGGLS